MKKIKIKSNPWPEDPRPWFKISVTDGNAAEVEILEANGLTRFREEMNKAGKMPLTAQQRTAVLGKERAASQRKYPLALTNRARKQGAPPPEADRPNLKDEVHVLAMTLEGDIEFVPFSEQRGQYYAHLGWYDPLTNEWTVLEFEEEVIDTDGEA